MGCSQEGVNYVNWLLHICGILEVLFYDGKYDSCIQVFGIK